MAPTEVTSRRPAGALPDVTRLDARDFYVVEEARPQRATDVVTRLMQERIPVRFGLDPFADVVDGHLARFACYSSPSQRPAG